MCRMGRQRRRVRNPMGRCSIHRKEVRRRGGIRGARALAEIIPKDVVWRVAGLLGIEWACGGTQPSHGVRQLPPSSVRPEPIRHRTNVAKTPPGIDDTSSLNLISLENVKPEPIEWLWPGYIPKAKITDVIGDGDLGKSLVLIAIIAKQSRGEPMPDNPNGPKGKPINIVMMVAEDDVADTVVPRLIAAGADLSRIKVLAGPKAGSETPIILPEDWPAVEAAVRDTNAGLLVIDPVMGFLGGDVKSGIDSAVRVALMGPAKALASKYDCAVLSLRHTNKSEGASASMRGGGSVAFRNACRAGLAFGPDYDDEDGERRIMVQSKKNLGRQRPALAYRIESSFGLVETEGEEGTPVVVWEGVAEGATPESVLGPRPQKRPGSRVGSKTEEATDWLRERLKDGISVAATIMQKEMEGEGFSKKVIETAKSRAGVESKRGSRGSGGDGSWTWSLR